MSEDTKIVWHASVGVPPPGTKLVLPKVEAKSYSVRAAPDEEVWDWLFCGDWPGSRPGFSERSMTTFRLGWTREEALNTLVETLERQEVELREMRHRCQLQLTAVRKAIRDGEDE